MILIARNDELIKKISPKFSLLDSSLLRIEIFSAADILNVYLEFVLQYPSGERIQIRFLNVKEYALNYSDDVYFYNLSSPKFFRINNGYYLSLDPFDESSLVSDADNDIVISEDVECYLLQ